MTRNPVQFFKIANNGGGEWRENDRVAFNLPGELLYSNQSAADPLHVRFFEKLPASSSRNPAVQTNALHEDLLCFLKRERFALHKRAFHRAGFLFTGDQLKLYHKYFLNSYGEQPRFRQTRSRYIPSCSYF